MISPLVANIYLNPVDHAFERNKLGATKHGSIHLVRYADDMVIRAQKNLNTTITLLEQYLDRLELRLNREKGATITDIGGAGRELSWISILLRQEQEDRHAVDVGIAQQTKSTTIPTKVADTCPSLDTVACQGAGGECQSPSVWLGTSA